MKVIEIVKLTNKYLAGEQLTYPRLLPFLDAVIDDINTQLNSEFPSFSDLAIENYPTATDVYSFFPDKYIRSVVCLGAACKFYLTDEEGNLPPEGYETKYQENLFYMVRDYIEQVPLAYSSASTGGVVFDEDDWMMNNALGWDIPERAAIKNVANLPVLTEITITKKGTYYPLDGADGFSKVIVDVKGFDDGDEGKVVHDGDLVTQTDLVTYLNGVFDTTLIKQITVDVPTYGIEDEGKVIHSGSLVSQTDITTDENGVFDTTFNKQITVNVPTFDPEADEGKVLHYGNFIAQTSAIFTANGSYNTTYINHVTVDIPELPRARGEYF